MAAPLEGLRILDWTAWQQGPTATCLLADMGAEVIKIEGPRGEPGRGLVKMMGFPVPVNFYFENHNRGKKGIVLNLQTEKGREVLYKLVEKSDAFVTNFRMSIAKRLKVDYETLGQYNSKLIYGHASGWGTDGPDADDPAYDLAGQGRGGMMGCTLSEDGTPIPIGSGMADQAGAMMLAYGLVLALFARERTGEGQMVDASLLGGQVEMCRLWFHGYLSGGLNLAVPYSRASSNPLWFHYKCQDGKWIVLSMLQPDRMWSGFCKAMQIEHLEKDPKFQDQAARAANVIEMRGIIADKFLTKPRDEWIRLLKGEECIVAPVNDFADLAEDVQVLANEYITDLEDPRHPDGKYKVPGIPVKLSKTPGRVTTPAPELGQHTEEVLMDILGYDWDELIELRDAGVY